jgi:hypothetical protein
LPPAFFYDLLSYRPLLEPLGEPRSRLVGFGETLHRRRDVIDQFGRYLGCDARRLRLIRR